MPRMQMALPPGIARNPTAEASSGRWWDSNNIRWRGGVLQPIGGNVMLTGSSVPDAPRDMLTWHDNSHRRWCAFGTINGLYVYSFDNSVVYTITPAGVGPLEPPGNLEGYGLSTYGTGLYGTPRSDFSVPAGIIGKLGDWWSMDTFGELLLIVPTQDGRLFVWNPNTPGTAAAQVANAPVDNRGVVVTDQRHVVLYGSGNDPRNIAWSDQENMNVWTPDIINLAGSKLLVTQAVALTALKVPQGILLFTTNDVHLMVYVGPPYAYGITQVGAGCGPISARAPVSQGSFVGWPSWQNFWTYSGVVQPLPCEVKDWFFASLNPTMAGWTFGSPVSQFAEAWWDYPGGDSVECSRYIAINYATSPVPWLIGQRTRTAADRVGTLTYPVLGGPGPDGTGGALYQHEYGWLDDTLPRASAGNVYIESGVIRLGEGDQRFNVMQAILDAVVPAGDPSFGLRFYAREQPFDTVERDSGLYTAIHNGLMDVRLSGRSVRMRIEATRDIGWELGRQRLLVTPAGSR